jgi:hypothetical protein
MRTRVLKYIVFIFIILILTNCEESVETGTEYTVSGEVQKGPFSSGGEVVLNVLDETYDLTGETFITSITDNRGNFNISNIILNSSLIELTVEGVYFNEVLGENSEELLRLQAICDISMQNQINVNILTHLEKHRVQHLLSAGKALEEAKQSAQKSIFDIFGYDIYEYIPSEELNIFDTGDMNAKLLAISVIIQANRDAAEINDLLANMSSDLKHDGKLDSKQIKNSLLKNSYLINLDNVLKNLSKFHATSDEFKPFVENFARHKSFHSLFNVDFPDCTEKGLNILDGKDNAQFLANTSYSLATKLPSSGEILDFEFHINLTSGTGEIFCKKNQNINSNWDFSATKTSLQASIIDIEKMANLQVLFYKTGEATLTKKFDVRNYGVVEVTQTFSW